MFDGQFKSKPTVTLRGSSGVKQDAKDVIAENRKRRETRQAHRDNEEAAKTIQRNIRGFLTRNMVKNTNRLRFDQLIASSDHDPIFSASLLCNFFHPKLDNERLHALISQINGNWNVFSNPDHVYMQIKLVLRCIENLHHRYFVHKVWDEKSLNLVNQIVEKLIIKESDLLTLTKISTIKPSYSKLIALIDRLSVQESLNYNSLVKLLKYLNSKYYSLVFEALVLNSSLNHRTKLFDVLSGTYQLQAAKILESVDLGLVISHICKDFNRNLSVLTHFLCKIMSDASSIHQDSINVLFNVLHNYEMPPVPDDPDYDSDDSDVEMSVVRFTYDFDCLDELFGGCQRGDYLEITHIVYLLITKFKMSVIQTSPLRRLCFNSVYVCWIWEYIKSIKVATIYSASSEYCIKKLTNNKALTNKQYQDIIPCLTVFSYLFHQYLLSSHDADFLEDASFIFSLPELRNISLVYRDLGVHLTNMDLIAIQPHKTLNFRSAFMSARHIAIPGSVPEEFSKIVLSTNDWMECYVSVTKLLSELYNRDSRVDIIEDKNEWLSKYTLKNISRDNIAVFIDPQSVPNLSLNTIKDLHVLHDLPFIVPFETRISVFHDILDEDRKFHYVIAGPQSSESVIKASIRRDYIYEDAYVQLTESLAPNLKRRILVQLINYSGLDEAGVDGGGLLREFLSSFLTEAFNPNRGFFIETDGLLHPNPAAQHLYPADFLKHFFFIGRLLGKTIYEKHLVDIPLASYFLHKLLGEKADINHLRSLDPDMYRNLLSLRGYTDEVLSELCLSFIVSDNILGETKTIELKPNGASTPVTRNNLIEYIHLMADYRLNRQIRFPFRHFAEGFYSVLSPEWLKMFSYSEFQSLISGSTADIDIEDLKNNTVYHGNYTAEHPTMQMFWEVVEAMTPDEHRKLLTFVTSTNRTPLLGFKALNPLFAIHSAGTEDRLPTSSTCMNLLKIAEFEDIEMLRKRLTYVIESGAGFELS